MGAVRALVVACAVVAASVALAGAAAPRTAPDFELELFSGKTFRLADARGSAVILLFWAPW